MDDIRVTVAVATVLRIFLEEVEKPQYGYDLMLRTGFASGKLYPILARLMRAGWLDRKVEDADPSALGSPARTLYTLNGRGVPAARNELAALTARLSPARRPDTRVRTAGSFS
jgi:PadR family transcriptional regulator PadR